MRLRAIIILAVVFMLAGCATTAKKNQDLEMQQLQMKVSDLESQVNQKDLVIRDLGVELEKYQAQKTEVGSEETSIKLTAKNIQKALLASNFYTGPIDCKIGKNTRSAIKEFQKANGLTADGVVGKQTWMKLKQYLEMNK